MDWQDRKDVGVLCKLDKGGVFAKEMYDVSKFELKGVWRRLDSWKKSLTERLHL